MFRGHETDLGGDLLRGARERLESGVAAAVTGGKRLRKFFETRELAEGFIADTRARVAALGHRAFSDPERPVEGRTVAAVWGLFYAEKEADFGRGDYLRDLRMVGKRFREGFGVRTVGEVTAAQINGWLRGLPIGATSRFNYFKVLRTFFRWAEMYEHCPTNPTRRVAAPRRSAPAKRILSVAEIEAALAGADAVVCLALLFGLFAGLRTAEILKLRWEDVDLVAGEIHVRPGVMKRTRGGIVERYVRIEPALAAWLAWAAARPAERKHGGGRKPCKSALGRVIAISEKPFRDRRAKLVSALGWAEWPDNCLRHSFASYHLAMFEDAGRTAHQMGHASSCHFAPQNHPPFCTSKSPTPGVRFS